MLSAPSFASAEIAAVLHGWLTSRLSLEVQSWLDERGRAVAEGDRQALFLTFGLVARKVGKADLCLSPVEHAEAAQIRPRWNPTGWTIDQAARCWLVLCYPSVETTPFLDALDRLYGAGEVHELVALYQGLPLWPSPSAHVLRCAEGIRSNIKGVFTAIAHRNPYPAERLSVEAWNQLVLKCLFVGVSLDPVVGLDERGNPALSRILVDYAEERWAAKRPVSPELWRPVGPHADDRGLAALQRLLTNGTQNEQRAAALALVSSADPNAGVILRDAPELAEAARGGQITWSQIAAAE